MSGDEFLLKWNDHHNSFFNIMQELCANEVLTDVTLACGGRVFETHKIMLCVCSAFFRQVGRWALAVRLCSGRFSES